MNNALPPVGHPEVRHPEELHVLLKSSALNARLRLGDEVFNTREVLPRGGAKITIDVRPRKDVHKGRICLVDGDP